MAYLARPSWGASGQAQLLSDHLLIVAQIARTLAEESRPDDPSFAQVAYRAGLSHDLGKYSDAFQERIRRAGSEDPGPRVEHSGHAAALALPDS